MRAELDASNWSFADEDGLGITNGQNKSISADVQTWDAKPRLSLLDMPC